MRNAPLINSNEALIAVPIVDGFGYCRNGHLEKASDIFDEIYDPFEIKEFLRLDLETKHISSINDEVANEWIEEHCDEIYNAIRFDEALKVPPFVDNSNSFDDWQDEIRSGIEEDRIYGTLAEQNRLRISDIR